jgi:hypothetical protein
MHLNINLIGIEQSQEFFDLWLQIKIDPESDYPGEKEYIIAVIQLTDCLF